MTDQNWEPLLYAKMHSFNVLPSLKPYTRVSVTGTVHSVSFKNYVSKTQRKKISSYNYFLLKKKTIYNLQMDPNFDKVCNFVLENSGDEIRVTVWESDLNKIKDIGTKKKKNFKYKTSK